MTLAYKTHLVELPLTTLHVLEVGSGPPLIVVPATISELDNWAETMQFMGQWFRVFFFELPGHGKSAPFKNDFSTQRVAQTVADFADSQGFERFSLMGFSFGGILVMRTYQLLQERIEHVLLLAPCLTSKAVLLSPLKNLLARLVDRLLLIPRLQRAVHKGMRVSAYQDWIVNFFGHIGKIEHPEIMKAKLSRVPLSTINVLAHQFKEVLNVQFPRPMPKYRTPGFFAMSSRDPLLDYQTTLNEMGAHFDRVHTVTLDFPFHQPPVPFTIEQLEHAIGKDLREFLGL